MAGKIKKIYEVMKTGGLIFCLMPVCTNIYCQDIARENQLSIPIYKIVNDPVKDKFIATTYLLDAALNSINAINSVIKKENYRTKIISFNNPATSDIGFSLEAEINLAIKPILEKSRNVNRRKFSEIVASLVYSPVKNQLPVKLFGSGTVFNSLLSFVGNLAINEKKVSREDVDSFVITIGKYFAQYEKLKNANISFDADIDKFNLKLLEIQFDIREFVLDIVTQVYPDITRQELRQKSIEEILLLYLDKDKLNKIFIRKNFSNGVKQKPVHYPGDGIKTAKEIVYGIQKLFNEYQKMYSQNYNEIRSVLLQTKELGTNINFEKVDLTVFEFDQLYSESKEADAVNLRLNTLSERLKHLVSTENPE